VREHLRAMGMKLDLSDISGPFSSAADLVGLMAQDKKVVDGQLRFILARDIGDAFVTSDVTAEQVISLMHDALNRGRG
jgi:3-dehydroquinate synthase